MEKSPDAFRTISEVADWLGVQAHVLRFWESKFAQVKPVKRAGGRRYYRPADMLLLGGIKKLLHEDGMTIKGVQKILREQGAAHVAGMSQSIDEPATLAEAPRSLQRPPPKVVSFEERPTPPDQADADRDAGQIELGRTSDTSGNTASEDRAPPAAPQPTEPEDARAAPPAAAEEPVEPVPTFRHRAAPTPPPVDAEPPDIAPPAQREAATAPDAPPEPTAQPQSPPTPTPTPRPRIVDAPDPPPENEIEAAPGALAALSALRRVSRDQAGEIAPLAQALSDWHQTQSAHQTPQ